MFRPRVEFAKLGDGFSDVVRPAEFPQTKLRFWNEPWAARVGLSGFSEENKHRHFAKFEALPGAQSQCLAMRYHGHQFRHYNPDLGDGRGFLFAQCEDLTDGRLLDFGTKGSGQTPYSRRGDGRLTLKGAVREALATEMLEAHGVYTSKTFSFFETGESLIRNDEPSPTRAAVLMRLSHGHIRYGTWQRLAYFQDIERLQVLTAASVRWYFPDLLERAPSEWPRLLLEKVVSNAADLTASWMLAGFVHGVLNTDNLNITGESFDYGPWRFLPTYDPDFTAAYFDESGLYCYRRQPEAVYWNLHQLAGSLALLRGAKAEAEFNAELGATVDRFPELFQRALLRRFNARLGLAAGESESLFLLAFALMRESGCRFEDFFFDWYGGGRRGGAREDFWRRQSQTTAFESELQKHTPSAAAAQVLTDAYYSRPEPETLLIEEVESIWRAIDQQDNWQPFEAKIASIRNSGRALAAGVSL